MKKDDFGLRVSRTHCMSFLTQQIYVRVTYISWFSDFAPYSLHCGLYEQCGLFLCVSGPNVRPKIDIGHCDLYFMV